MGIHIGVRAGTDLALALAMLKVIISEGLCEKDFVEKWTIGFDKLKEHVKQYPPEKVEEITWVPAVDSKRIDRIYATTKPARIVQGINSLDRSVNGIQNFRVLSILEALVGSVRGWVRNRGYALGLRLALTGETMTTDTYPSFCQIWGRTQPLARQWYFMEWRSPPPTSPAFYHKPKTINDLVDHVMGKTLDEWFI